jgi:hypothetical protein
MRRNKIKIKGRKVSNLISLEVVIILICKINHFRVDQRWIRLWGKGKDNQLNDGGLRTTYA